MEKFFRTFQPPLLRLDNAPENRSKQMKQILPVSTTLQFTNPYTPQQNSLAETTIATLTADTRSLLRSSTLPSTFWTHAWLYANFIRNRLTAKKLDLTPQELAFGEPPDMSQIKPFGCLIWIQVPSQIRSKLSNTAIPGIFLGYSSDSAGVSTFIPDRNLFTSSTRVHFQEETKARFLLSRRPPKEPPLIKEAIFSSIQPHVPNNIPDAITGPQRNEWKKAILQEISNLEEFNVYTIIETPPYCHQIGSTVVFRQKYDGTGHPTTKKVRICAQGFAQRPDEYSKTFSPTASADSLRIFFSFTATNRHVLRQYDVTAAYLHAPLE